MSTTPRAIRKTARVAAGGFLLAACWGVFFGAEPLSWVIGLPAIAAALVVRLRTDGPEGAVFSGPGCIRFALFFLRASLAGGIDVVIRAFHPRLPLRPGFVTRRLRLSLPVARILCAATASLLPGTVSVELDEDRLTLHALDCGSRLDEQMAELELRVGGVFGLSPSPEPGVS